MDSQCILQRILQASMGGELHQAGLSLKRRRGRNSVKSISTQHWLQRIQIIPTAQPGHGECKDVSTVRSSLLCGRAWWAPAVSGVTNTVWKFKEMEKGSLPVGSSITHSLARFQRWHWAVLSTVLLQDHLDAPWQSGAMKSEVGSIPGQDAETRRLHGDWTLLQSFSAVQIYQSIFRKGTQSIKLCEAQDQGTQRKAHSSECLLVVWAQC